jgi:hypothetical protein
MGIKNVCLSRHQKADLISSRIGIQTRASLTYLVAQKPDQTPAVQSVHNPSRTETELQNTIATKLYVEMSCMSNQQKDEFVGDVFHIRSFWRGHGEISPKNMFYTGRYDLLEMLI